MVMHALVFLFKLQKLCSCEVYAFFMSFKNIKNLKVINFSQSCKYCIIVTYNCNVINLIWKSAKLISMYAVTLGHYLVKIVNYTCKTFTAVTPGCLIDTPVAMNSLLKWQKTEIFPRSLQQHWIFMMLNYGSGYQQVIIA
jgi:hypothetical protein